MNAACVLTEIRSFVGRGGQAFGTVHHYDSRPNKRHATSTVMPIRFAKELAVLHVKRSGGSLLVNGSRISLQELNS
jgi:hypothetical protein